MVDRRVEPQVGAKADRWVGYWGVPMADGSVVQLAVQKVAAMVAAIVVQTVVHSVVSMIARKVTWLVDQRAES